MTGAPSGGTGSADVVMLPVCRECAKGHHVYCLDDGSSTVECRCPCGDESVRPYIRPAEDPHTLVAKALDGSL